MSSIRWPQLLVVIALMGVSMSGCGRGILNTEPFVDAKKDEHGKVILLDTPRMWQYWREDTDRDVAREVAGMRPGGGIPSWNAFWLRVISANSDRENAPKYIAYIIESRRRAGLPELEGYPPPAGD
jgi:hypothetical protein